MILLDCSPGVRRDRLARRGALDLASERMEDWAAYLRREATSLGVRIVQTDEMTVDEVADTLEGLARP